MKIHSNVGFLLSFVDSVSFAVTEFADWTWEEFHRHRLGAAQNCSATKKGNHKLTDDLLPEMVLPSALKN